MKTMLRLVVSVFLLVQASCAVLLPASVTPQSAPTPTVPAELRVLPRSARVRIEFVHPAWGPGEIYIWELPGVKPSDADSAYMGNRGKPLGTLLRGTEVTIINYAWSDTDQEFWVYVRTPGVIEGWIPLNQLDLTP